VGVEVAETESAHRSNRAQFCVRSKVFVPLVLVKLVSEGVLLAEVVEESLTQSMFATASIPGSAEESRLTPV
jgi:hypothetical protein